MLSLSYVCVCVVNNSSIGFLSKTVCCLWRLPSLSLSLSLSLKLKKTREKTLPVAPVAAFATQSTGVKLNWQQRISGLEGT